MSSDKVASLQGRVQGLVAWLQPRVDPSKLDKTRVKNLAAMIRRNGLLLTMTYLDGKSEANAQDRELSRLLAAAIPRALGAVDDQDAAGSVSVKDLAALDPLTALQHEEAAIEVAVWIARLHDAQATSPQATVPGEEAPR